MSDWKVFETETMAIIARSEQEVFSYLVNGLWWDAEEAQTEMENIKEIPLTNECRLINVDDVDLDSDGFPDGIKITHEDYTGAGDVRPVISGPYQLFVDMMVQAGDAPGMIWCSEY